MTLDEWVLVGIFRPSHLLIPLSVSHVLHQEGDELMVLTMVRVFGVRIARIHRRR